MKGKHIKVQRSDGSIIAATVLYGSGDNLTVQGADGFVYEIDRNIRSGDGSYVAL